MTAQERAEEYLRVHAELSDLTKTEERIINDLLAAHSVMLEALENIIKHQTIISGSFADKSAVVKIAREAVEKVRKGNE